MKYKSLSEAYPALRRCAKTIRLSAESRCERLGGLVDIHLAHENLTYSEGIEVEEFAEVGAMESYYSRRRKSQTGEVVPYAKIRARGFLFPETHESILTRDSIRRLLGNEVEYENLHGLFTKDGKIIARAIHTEGSLHYYFLLFDENGAKVVDELLAAARSAPRENKPEVPAKMGPENYKDIEYNLYMHGPSM